MSESKKKYRFVLIQAFQLPADSPYRLHAAQGPIEKRIMNYEQIAPLLEDVDWDLHPGATSL